jgi:hypothetical protein
LNSPIEDLRLEFRIQEFNPPIQSEIINLQSSIN